MKASPSKNAKLATATPSKVQPSPPPSPYVEKRIKKSLIKFIGNLDLKSRSIAIQYLILLSNNGLYYFDITRVLFACKEAIVNFECQDDEIENNYKQRDIPKYLWEDDYKASRQSQWVAYDLKTCNRIYRAELHGIPYIDVDAVRFFDINRHLQVRYDDHCRFRMGKKEKEENIENNGVKSSSYTWFWLGDYDPSLGSKPWIEYSSKVCKKLDEGFEKGDLKVLIDSERYVNTKTMMQHRIDSPYRLRQVKRIQSGSTLSPNKNISNNNNTPISTPSKSTKSTPSTPSKEDISTPTKSVNMLGKLFSSMKTSDSPAKSLSTTSNNNRFDKVYGLTRDQHIEFIEILEDFLDKYPEKNEHSIHKYKKFSDYSDNTTLYPVQAEITDSFKLTSSSTSTETTTTTTTTTETTTTTTTTTSSDINHQPAKKEISQACEVIINLMIQLVMKNNAANSKKSIYLSYKI